MDCDRAHQKCRVQSTLPPGFQVIDINRRCIVQGGSCNGFAALSYVWGSRSKSAHYLQEATCKNIESLKTPGGLGLGQLPETVEDALEICRVLDIKYLWVDRYCIVQDHGAHKHTQISAMGDIYSSATITIIACSGKDGVESGIPGVRRRRQWKRNRINIQGIEFRHALPRLDSIMRTSIWNTRGWTYQEAALSARKLIMTPMEAWFDCRMDNYREDHHFPPFNDRETKFQAPRRSDWHTTFEDYTYHLQKYTERELGFQSDIYNAFDGIAHAIYAEGHLFHFGLPESQFDQAILWFCNCQWSDCHDDRRRCCEQTTPSWSWGSITCNISLLYLDLAPFCMTLVRWVLYEDRMSGMNPIPVPGETHCSELEATDEPSTWRKWRDLQKGVCPQLFLALAMKEGCIQSKKPCVDLERDSFPDLQAQFTSQWPTYLDAYKEVRQISPLKSSRPNGVLFTNAYAASFRIGSKFIKNSSGMVIGSVYQMFHSFMDEEPREFPNVEAIALSISGNGEMGEMLSRIGLDIPVNPNMWDEDDIPKETLRDFTYFDCDDVPILPVPVVNIMIISWEDGYARRVAPGWIALKQWSSVDWTLKEIWLK